MPHTIPQFLSFDPQNVPKYGQINKVHLLITVKYCHWNENLLNNPGGYSNFEYLPFSKSSAVKMPFWNRSSRLDLTDNFLSKAEIENNITYN